MPVEELERLPVYGENLRTFKIYGRDPAATARVIIEIVQASGSPWNSEAEKIKYALHNGEESEGRMLVMERNKRRGCVFSYHFRPDGTLELTGPPDSADIAKYLDNEAKKYENGTNGHKRTA